MASGIGASGRVDFGGRTSLVDSIKGWTYDPVAATLSTTAVDGSLYLGLLEVWEAGTITTGYFGIGTGASGAQANQCWMGLYNEQGELLTKGDVASSITSGGLRTVTFNTPVFLNPGRYWFAIVVNATTTDPSFLRCGTVSLNLLTVGQDPEHYRFARNGTGLTDLPATITPASNVTTGSFGMWAAVS